MQNKLQHNSSMMLTQNGTEPWEMLIFVGIPNLPFT
jgi:hypothetical protein